MTRPVTLRPHRRAPWSDLDGRVEPMTWRGKLLTALLLLAAVGLPLGVALSEAIRDARAQEAFQRELSREHRATRQALAEIKMLKEGKR